MDKCKVLHISANDNPRNKYYLDGNELLSTESEKDLGFIMDEKFDFSEHINLSEKLSLIRQKSLELGCEKGASCWLSALPLRSVPWVCPQQERVQRQHLLALRYGWAIANVPRYCSCGKKNDIDHALSCKSGPYVNFRHNAVRDAYAEILKEVCVDVRTEPGLLPVNPANLSSSAITTDQARLVVWSVSVARFEISKLNQFP